MRQPQLKRLLTAAFVGFGLSILCVCPPVAFSSVFRSGAVLSAAFSGLYVLVLVALLFLAVSSAASLFRARRLSFTGVLTILAGAMAGALLALPGYLLFGAWKSPTPAWSNLGTVNKSGGEIVAGQAYAFIIGNEHSEAAEIRLPDGTHWTCDNDCEPNNRLDERETIARCTTEAPWFAPLPPGAATSSYLCKTPRSYHYFVLLKDGTAAVTLFPTPSLPRAALPMVAIGTFIALGIVAVEYRRDKQSLAQSATVSSTMQPTSPGA
jgi:hypothetical protein